MVEVFVTNISSRQAAALVLKHLQGEIPEAKINFDLDDCDNILRVESDAQVIAPVKLLLHKLGYHCEVLDC